MSELPVSPLTARHPELAGRVAVVTGGARGIGWGIAQRLAVEGMRLLLADVDEGALKEAVTNLDGPGTPHETFVGDLSQPGDIAALFEHATSSLGGVDLLVNNAADLGRKRLLDDHEALLDLQLATNVRGPYVCSQRAAAIMREAGRGSIVHISSVGGVQAHYRGLPYDVTKGAIDAMTRAMAIDLGGYGVRVNAVAPGVTFTYRTEPYKDSPRYLAALGKIPLQRSGTIFDIAAAVAFLASDDASYITGQVLYVDGGLTAQLAPPEPGDLADGGANAPSHGETGV